MKLTVATFFTVIAIFTGMATAVSGCGDTEEGIVTGKIHVPAGTPNTETGGVHEEQFFIHCRGVSTGLRYDIKVTRAEYDRTEVDDDCDPARGK